MNYRRFCDGDVRRAVTAALILLAMLAASAGAALAQQDTGEAAGAGDAAVVEEAGEPAAIDEELDYASESLYYVNPLWLALFVFSALFWLYLTQWVSNDAVSAGMDFQWMAAMMLGSGLPGVILALLVHAAFACLTIGGAFAAFTGYIIRRNRIVPDKFKFLGAEHRARILQRIPLLKKLPSAPSRFQSTGTSLPMTNADDETLEDLLLDRREFVEPAGLMCDALARAYATESDEIQFRPEDDQYVLRFVMDGMLHRVEEFPIEVGQRLLACASVFLKLTKDGRVRQGTAPVRVDLPGMGETELEARVAAVGGKPALSFKLPSWNRTLHRQGLEALGMHAAIVKRVKAVLEQDAGAIIVCSPPENGKTTTLHALVGEVDFFTTDIFVIDKEEELPLEHVRRWTIPEDTGFTQFYESVLREGPHHLMFANLETPEQVQCALSFASEQGLMMGAITAASAPEALLRLARMDGDPERAADAVTCIICQQLLRKLCPDCKEEVEANPRLLAKLNISPEEPGIWYRPVGCEACLQSGYKGRTGIFAMLILTEPVKEALIRKNATPTDVRRAAGTMALRTLYQDGLSKVTAGITTLEELRRVLKEK